MQVCARVVATLWLNADDVKRSLSVEIDSEAASVEI